MEDRHFEEIKITVLMRAGRKSSATYLFNRQKLFEEKIKRELHSGLLMGIMGVGRMVETEPKRSAMDNGQCP